MQRSGTEAIRTQIQPSKPKREITKITNNQNTKRIYGQPSEQYFPKGGNSATQTELKTSSQKGNDHSTESQQVIKIFEIVLKQAKDFLADDALGRGQFGTPAA